MIIGCVQPKRFPAKAARTFMALLLATLKNEHANRAGVRRHDQICLLVQRAGQARPDTGVGREHHEEIAEERRRPLCGSRLTRFVRFKYGKVRAKTLAGKICLMFLAELFKCF